MKHKRGQLLNTYSIHIMLDLAVNKLHEYKAEKTEEKYSLRHYRFFSIVGVIAIPLYYYILKATVQGEVDFMSLRLVLSVLCLLGFVFTFSKGIVKQYLDEYTLFIVLSISLHGIFLLHLNQFNYDFIVAFYFTSILCSVAVRKRNNLIILLTVTFISFTAISFVHNPLGTSVFYILTVGITFLTTYFILNHIHSLENEIQLRGRITEALFSESPDAVFFVDKHTDNIVDVNNKAQRLFGTKEKLTGKSFQELLKYDYRRNLRSGHEITILNMQGEGVWVDLAWQQVQMDAKEYSIIRLMDITDKKKVEAELIARDELLHGVAEASGILLLKRDFNNSVKSALQIIGKSSGVDRIYMYENLTDNSGNIIFNHRFEWIKETDSFRVNRIRLQNLSYNSYLPHWINDLKRGKVVKGLVENFLQEERALFIAKGAKSVMIIPIIIEEQFGGFIGFEHDKENHLWNQNEENHLRTAATSLLGAFIRNKAEHELIEAKQIAEDSSKAKESFLANVSHEIRTPMNGILGLTQLLQKSKLDEKQLQYINAIRQSSEHLLVIINDLLDFSKMVAGQVEFEKIEFELNGILYNINQTYGSRALEKGIQLLVEMNENVPEKLIGDPVRLNQILVNLIGNAIKFTEEGHVALRISCIESDNNQPRLEFIIEDTGIGIPEDKLDSIFESFKQASSETTRKYGGTGLGLSIVKRLLDAQNGKIQVQSIPGKGSRFVFDLLFKKEESVTVIETADSEAYHSLKSVRVLLAEDNVVNQLLANDLISHWGAVIDIADNGGIAITMLKQNTYDLVLMDVQMPEVNGLEATEIIRKYCDAPLNNIPIIAMTANAIKGDNEKYLSIGMTDYITKPFNPLDLNKKIWQYLTPEKRLQAEQPSGTEPKTKTVEQEFTSDIIDLSNLKEFSRGKIDFILKMLMLLQEQTPPAIEQIGTGIKTSDWVTVRALAHKMKPNISLLGIPDMDALILKIEKNAESMNKVEEMPENFEKFIQYLNPAMEEVKRAILHYKSTPES